jgi:protein-S-isoprenylcysteine O-methyltransferase Ste14
MRLTILTMFILCFASFGWAMYGGFFKVEKRVPAWGMVVRIVSTVCAFLQIIVLTTTDGFQEYAVVLSMSLYAASLALFWVTIFANWRNALHHCFTQLTPQHLVDWGPYRYVRHPFYLSYTLAWVAGSLLASTPWLWVTVAAMGWLYWRAASREAVFKQSDRGSLRFLHEVCGLHVSADP